MNINSKIELSTKYIHTFLKEFENKIYKTILLPVVIYGCETWSLTLRQECRLRVFENIWIPEGMSKWNGEGSTMRNLIFYTVHLM